MSMLIPNLEDLVPASSFYCQLLKLINFEELTNDLEKLYSRLGRSSYPVSSSFKMLLVQYIEDTSDRELEEMLRDSLAIKLFCGFGLTEQTPDHSYFSKFRKRLGTKELAGLFNKFREALKKANFIGEVFSFVDSSSLKSRIDVWEARDKAISDDDNDFTDEGGTRKLCNQNMSQYSSDPDARFGCKGKNKFWIGYKRHVCVDMKQGLITKTTITPANIHDSKGIKHVCPNQGMVFADKAYSGKTAQRIIKQKGCHSGVIKPNNFKEKNHQKDAWLTRTRMPYEGTFAAMTKFSRYRTLVKVQFQAFMDAFAFNLKRLINIAAPPLVLTKI